MSAPKEQLQRVERLIRLRERVEDERRAALERAKAEQRRADQARRHAEVVHTQAGQSLLSPQPLPASELDFRASQVERARHGIARREEELAAAGERHAEAAESLARARRDVVALERVEERLSRELDARRQRAEQQVSDEAAARLTRKERP